MNEYETEEQQVEALKKWWQENGSSLIIGLALGVSALFGWRYYDQQKEVHSLEASSLYMQIARDVSMQAVNDKTIDMNNRLLNEFSDTPYAALSSMALGRAEYIRGDAGQALAQMELAHQHASDDVIRHISALRLARLYIEQKQFAQAKNLLTQDHPQAYEMLYQELAGDLYQAQGELNLAEQAYDKAISLQGAGAGKWLKLKRQNLGLAPLSKTAVDSETEAVPDTEANNGKQPS